jgi:EpsI family protein
MQAITFLAIAVLTVSLSHIAKPEKSPTGQLELAMDMENIAPAQVGDWQLIEDIPQVAMGGDDANDLAQKLYDNILMRTYKNKETNQLMWLVVARGDDQRGDFAVHLPEMCYRSQGFNMANMGVEKAEFGHYSGEMKKLVARNQYRTEPITYWVMIDDEVVTDQFQQKLMQLYYGLTGKVRQGTLVRVSMPSTDFTIEKAFKQQQEFIQDLFDVWPEQHLALIWPQQSQTSQGMFTQNL